MIRRGLRQMVPVALCACEVVEGFDEFQGFKVDVRPIGKAELTVGANDEARLVALMLKRQREAHGLTLVEVARRLHSRSPNAYARYEQGKSVPTVAKLNQLMKAIGPAFEPILRVA